MRNRKIQRQLKKAGIQKTDKPWLNSEGYNDPTVFSALRNIERAEQRQTSIDSKILQAR